MATAKRWVYSFGNGKADGKGDQKELLGGKGAGLAEMTRIGLPVPAGFTVTTEACEAYNRRGQKWPVGMDRQVRQSLAKLERTCKKKFGAPKNPLLVSVRSGAARSMPGMMETVLNLGLTDRSVEGLAQATSNRRFPLDAYRRLIMMYGVTAKGIDRELFDNAFERLKRTRTGPRMGNVEPDHIGDTDVDADELAILIDEYKSLYREHCGEEFPQDPWLQLKGAIGAVFDSWMADKAITYRRVEKITGLPGTGVNICQMVFGNLGADSGTGVCFTRDPSTGESVLYGEYLVNAQGEDVVAGVRTPIRLDKLKQQKPAVYEQLEAVRVMLEVHYKEMQDLEFTYEADKLYMLQCRAGKRSPQAAFKIAVDQATRGLISSASARGLVKKKYLPKKYAKAATQPIITKDEAIQRATAEDIERLFYPVLNPDIPATELASRHLADGIGAVPGAACGEIVFTPSEAESRAASGASVILVRKETSPEDVGGMHAAIGILTATGGKTSHAAVVARGWGKCCIVGCAALSVDYSNRQMKIGGRVLHEGDSITLDGTTGRIYEGSTSLVRPEEPPEYQTLLRWCDQRRRLAVRANADTPEDAARAIELGAEGIGLCRTEHMFFDPSQPQRLIAMRRMILADNEDHRRNALAIMLPFQRKDFEGIFTAMNGLPVTIRLLDPPLHEFLPNHDNPAGQAALADDMIQDLPPDFLPVEQREGGSREEAGIASQRDAVLEEIRRRVDQLHESNPMLGHRGCRLCITYPEILDMQVRAIMEAAVRCAERGIKPLPEIMIPLSIDDKELSWLIDRTRAVADAVLKEHKRKLKYLVGTMVETPRACLVAQRMAGAAEFFSFGTNDLTQMTMGISRDDAGRFLPDYLTELKPFAHANAPDAPLGSIFSDDPFESLDVDGVGQLMSMAVSSGRAGRRDIKLGICGEHGGDPKSIRFCEQLRLDYVSCSPLRVPIARMAAAQAAIAATGPGGGTQSSKRSRTKSKVRSPKVLRTARRKKTVARSSAARRTKVKTGPLAGPTRRTGKKAPRRELVLV